MCHEIITSGCKSIPAKIITHNINPLRRIHCRLNKACLTDIRPFQMCAKRLRTVIDIRQTRLQQMRQTILLAHTSSDTGAVTAVKIRRPFQRLLAECRQNPHKIRRAIDSRQPIYILGKCSLGIATCKLRLHDKPSHRLIQFFRSIHARLICLRQLLRRIMQQHFPHILQPIARCPAPLIASCLHLSVPLGHIPHNIRQTLQAYIHPAALKCHLIQVVPADQPPRICRNVRRKLRHVHDLTDIYPIIAISIVRNIMRDLEIKAFRKCIIIWEEMQKLRIIFCRLCRICLHIVCTSIFRIARRNIRCDNHDLLLCKHASIANDFLLRSRIYRLLLLHKRILARKQIIRSHNRQLPSVTFRHMFVIKFAQDRLHLRHVTVGRKLLVIPASIQIFHKALAILLEIRFIGTKAIHININLHTRFRRLDLFPVEILPELRKWYVPTPISKSFSKHTYFAVFTLIFIVLMCIKQRIQLPKHMMYVNRIRF